MKKGKFYYCDNCKKKLNKKRDFIQEPEPYIDEVEHERVIVDLCERCCISSSRDI